MAVIGGLCHSSISRLKETSSHVPHEINKVSAGSSEAPCVPRTGVRFLLAGVTRGAFANHAIPSTRQNTKEANPKKTCRMGTSQIRK